MTNGEGAGVPMLTLKRLVNHATGEADVNIGTDLEAMREASEAIVQRIFRGVWFADDSDCRTRRWVTLLTPQQYLEALH